MTLVIKFRLVPGHCKHAVRKRRRSRLFARHWELPSASSMGCCIGRATRRAGFPTACLRGRRLQEGKMSCQGQFSFKGLAQGGALFGWRAHCASEFSRCDSASNGTASPFQAVCGVFSVGFDAYFRRFSGTRPSSATQILHNAN